MQLTTLARNAQITAAVAGRLVLGGMFLLSAYLKIPGTANFTMEIAMSARAGIPFPAVAVLLALVLGLVGGLMLVLGWHTRTAAAVLAPYVLLLALIFYHNFSDPVQAGYFTLHLTFIAGLLYLFAYGSQHAALRKDPELL